MSTYGGTINLWCDGRVRDGESENVRKRKRDAETSKKQHIDENESNVDEVCQKLLEKHGSTFDTPRFRLCICSDQHQSYDEPPNLPPFKTEPATKKRKESLTEALTGAAVAFASAVSGGKQPQSTSGASLNAESTSGVAIAAVSPGKAVELRMKN